MKEKNSFFNYFDKQDNLNTLLNKALAIPYQKMDTQNDVLLNAILKSTSIQEIKVVFIYIKQAHSIYIKRSYAIKILYITWIKNSKKERSYNKNGLEDWRNFSEIVPIISKEISDDLSSIFHQHRSIIPAPLINEANTYLTERQNKYLIDFITMNHLYWKIIDSLPNLYTQWAVSLQLFDEGYTIKPSYHKQNIGFDVVYDIKPKALSIIKKTHTFHKIEQKSPLIQYLNNIRSNEISPSDLKNNYELWLTELTAMELSPIYENKKDIME
jgi:hypothetical protein